VEPNTQKTEEAIRQAESAIRAVVGKLNATSDVRRADSDDVAQILRMHIAEKAAEHDPSRSSLKTFIERIVVNKIRDILDGQHAQCRDSRKESNSLDEPEIAPDGEIGSFGETLDQEDALRRAGMLPWPADEALVMDVKMVLENLSALDRLTCEALAINKSLRETAKDLGIHVETLRQRMRRIRAIFEAWGIHGV
jgi:RNA polymerase sigma factor (sigma-70 family)